MAVRRLKKWTVAVREGGRWTEGELAQGVCEVQHSVWVVEHGADGGGGRQPATDCCLQRAVQSEET